MGLKEFMQTLDTQGIAVCEHQLRYAIKRGRVTKPALDPSLSYVFEEMHVEQCRKLFAQLQERANRLAQRANQRPKVARRAAGRLSAKASI